MIRFVVLSSCVNLLRRGNTRNKIVQLVAQHCCFASRRAMLLVFPPTPQLVTQQKKIARQVARFCCVYFHTITTGRVHIGEGAVVPGSAPYDSGKAQEFIITLFHTRDAWIITEEKRRSPCLLYLRCICWTDPFLSGTKAGTREHI